MSKDLGEEELDAEPARVEWPEKDAVAIGRRRAGHGGDDDAALPADGLAGLVKERADRVEHQVELVAALEQRLESRTVHLTGGVVDDDVVHAEVLSCGQSAASDRRRHVPSPRLDQLHGYATDRVLHGVHKNPALQTNLTKAVLINKSIY